MNEASSGDGAQRWQPGDAITLRYVGHHDGVTRDRPGLLIAMPHIVVQDDDEALVLWIPTGSQRYYADMADRARVVEPDLWRADCIRIMPSGKPYSVMLFWRTAEGGGPREFRGWYVNLEAPYVRTAIGVDTTDNSLDVVIAPDRTWRWKDEDHNQRWIDLGTYTEAEIASFYEHGRDAIALLEDGAFPFDGAYVHWTPAPHWGIPEAHSEWPYLEPYDTPLTTGRQLPWVDTPVRP